jgi:putative hydrolase of the HAD superfamily
MVMSEEQIIDWQQIDTVLLDMDGTILDLHFDNHFWLEHLPMRFAEQFKLEEAAAREYLTELVASQRGSLNWYCLEYWSEKLELDIVALKREIQHLIAVRPFALEFLHELKEAGKHLILITNAHQQSLDLKLDNTPIGQYFDQLLTSHEFGYAKEQPEFWVAFQQAHPFDPQRTVFIDDTASVLQSAEQFGIRYLLTLRQPDSQQLPREVLEYPGFHHFDEILPSRLAARAVQAGRKKQSVPSKQEQ